MNKCIINNMCNCSLLDDTISRICLCEYQYFLSKINVVGVGFGYKQVNGIDTDIKCITVFVEKKVPLSQLAPSDIIPPYYKHIPTDVFESGVFELQALNHWIRPVTGGYSISNQTFPRTGSLSCLVTDGIRMYILGNNHILASSNRAPIGSYIVQPSIGDGGRQGIDVIASLSRFIPLNFQGQSNFVDSAIAEVMAPGLISPYIAIVGPPKGTKYASLSESVMKIGRTSEKTTGKITQLHSVILVRASSTQKYLMIDQIITQRMSDMGDSGALLLDSNVFALGQLVGAAPYKSIYTPINTILDTLNVSLVTG
ncbi:hypothetical protein G8V03_05775 [Clostridium botulinum D/C]|uniref:S1 family peptidase n=1 Tax=Clostridium botulinum TaxID=1491 RepID=UPI001E3413FF|nr:S1 family peptidase [Clostridium botulinum]MCD3350444.1 hypothetical protein [Clostridium botulinum D/C]MCD3359464.1 hypothetical protein [Clostridium botulinum D/C]MCD3363898.1 hypothetical protein [Clostridium botulinum D/C]MCD3365159.1 hypothetical protein [Clostridium botulinum D/C]